MNISRYFYTMRNLMEIKRYQNKVTLVPRTIAEHKFAYTKISFMIAYWEERLTGKTVDIGKLLEKGILRGTIKAITGDIQNNTIEATPNMKNIILNTYSKFYDSSYCKLMPEHVSKRIRGTVLYEPDDSIEQDIIYVASLINRMLECIEEISFGNEDKFQKILEDAAEELINMDMEFIKIFFSEMPEELLKHLYKLDEKIKETEVYVYDTFSAKDIFEFRRTFYEYIVEIRGLMGVQRYQNLFKQRKASVAEHQWFVALLSLFSYYYIDEEVDLKDLLIKALFHDDIELYTGDILSETKNAYTETREEVERVELKYYQNIYSTFIPKDINEYIMKNVLEPKDNTIEGKILAMADVLDTIYESKEELLLGNEMYFRDIMNKSLEKLEMFREEFSFIEEFFPMNELRLQ